jgi:hypothetical protein
MMHSVRQQLVITVAAVGLIAGISGSAFAQDNPAQGGNAPAERMEKGDNGAQQQQRRTHDTMGQQEEQRGAGAPGQSQRKAQGETGSGAAPNAQPEGANKTGQNVDQGKRDGATRADQGSTQGVDRDQPQRTGQDDRTRERNAETNPGQSGTRSDADTRTGQGERNQRNDTSAGMERGHGGAGNDMNVRVNGDLHLSQEKATRISQALKTSVGRENVRVDVRVGAPIPEHMHPMPLPPDVATLVPEYRGYEYFVANDAIVIVQPTSHVVVGTIDEGGASAQLDAGQQIARAKPCPVE